MEREESIARDPDMIEGLNKGSDVPQVIIEREHEFYFVWFYFLNDSGNFHRENYRCGNVDFSY